jgi:urease accessory protein
MGITPATAALLHLADGRFPAGGHAHSGGMEEAVADGRVRGLGSLEPFLRGRLWTVGRAEAAVSAAACVEAVRPAPDWAGLDAEAAARCPSVALRRSSRALGRGLLRAAASAWPGEWAHRLRDAVPDGPLAPMVLGAACAAAGVTPAGAALVGAHGAITAPAGAAVRLLGLDPFEVAAVVAGLGVEIDEVTADVSGLVAVTDRDWATLPAGTAPLIEIGAELHAAWEVRLFAS